MARSVGMTRRSKNIRTESRPTRMRWTQSRTNLSDRPERLGNSLDNLRPADFRPPAPDGGCDHCRIARRSLACSGRLRTEIQGALLYVSPFVWLGGVIGLIAGA